MKFSFSGLIKRFDMAKKRINDLKLGQKKFTQPESQKIPPRRMNPRVTEQFSVFIREIGTSERAEEQE